MSSSTTRLTILVLSCFIAIFIQESFEISVDFCWSTEPIDVVYLLNNDVAKENWNIDLFKASVKGLSLYLPWIRTIHVFSNHSRARSRVSAKRTAPNGSWIPTRNRIDLCSLIPDWCLKILCDVLKPRFSSFNVGNSA